MNDVGIDLGVDDGAAQVIRSRDVVVDGVPLGLGILHGVGSRALLGEVYDGVGLLVLDKLDEEVVVLGNIEIDEFHILPRHLLPCTDAYLFRTEEGKDESCRQLSYRMNECIHHELRNQSPPPQNTKFHTSRRIVFSLYLCVNTRSTSDGNSINALIINLANHHLRFQM